MKNQIKHLLLLTIAVLFIVSCDEDKYGDWKIINESWYNNFIEEHKNDSNFYITDSGLAYHVIHHGQYPQQPYIGSFIEVSYKGKLISNREFDTQNNSPVILSESIEGWREGLPIMTTGSHYIFYIPYKLGYGKKGGARIPPYSTLIFDIELKSVMN